MSNTSLAVAIVRTILCYDDCEGEDAKPSYPEGTCIAFCSCVHHDSKVCGWIATLSSRETVGANGDSIEPSDALKLDDLEYDEMDKTIL